VAPVVADEVDDPIFDLKGEDPAFRTGAPIFIGDSTTFTAPTGGEIWLGVNDIDPGNNAGEFAVDVCLK